MNGQGGDDPTLSTVLDSDERSRSCIWLFSVMVYSCVRAHAMGVACTSEKAPLDLDYIHRFWSKISC